MYIDENNIIFTFDSYKHYHPEMLPEGTKKVYGYFESRVGGKYTYTIPYGLQYIIKKWLLTPITKKMVDDAEIVQTEHFKFAGKKWDRSRWDYIVEKHGGKLPVEIKAVLEGTKVPTSNVLFTIENTDDECAWLACGLETVLQQTSWYGTTVATRAHVIVSTIKHYFKETVVEEDQWLSDFYLHDFAQRGVSCMEQAGIGGSAALVSTKGTDTQMAIPYALNYYNASLEGLAYSVVATEHSIMSALGETGEHEMVDRLLDLYPNGILSMVSDTYNIENLVYAYCTKFRNKVLKRNGKLVVRPDSPRFKGDTPAKQILWIVETLWQHYQGYTNKKGFRVLDSHVGVIYGDSLTEEEIAEALQLLKDKGYSAQNCVYGCGGYLLQKVNRDTLRFAVKASAHFRDGQWVDIFKKPLDESKTSKKGRLKLVTLATGVHTVGVNDPGEDMLVPVYRNGELLIDQKFEDIRARAWPTA